MLRNWYLTQAGQMSSLHKNVTLGPRKILWRTPLKTEQEHVNLESVITMLSTMWTKREDSVRPRRAEESDRR